MNYTWLIVRWLAGTHIPSPWGKKININTACGSWNPIRTFFFDNSLEKSSEGVCFLHQPNLFPARFENSSAKVSWPALCDHNVCSNRLYCGGRGVQCAPGRDLRFACRIQSIRHGGRSHPYSLVTTHVLVNADPGGKLWPLGGRFRTAPGRWGCGWCVQWGPQISRWCLQTR